MGCHIWDIAHFFATKVSHRTKPEADDPLTTQSSLIKEYHPTRKIYGVFCFIDSVDEMIYGPIFGLPGIVCGCVATSRHALCI